MEQVLVWLQEDYAAGESDTVIAQIFRIQNRSRKCSIPPRASTVWSENPRGPSSGLLTTAQPEALWPLKVLSLPVGTSQSLTVWSLEPEARVLPSGLQATLEIPRYALARWSAVCQCLPPRASPFRQKNPRPGFFHPDSRLRRIPGRYVPPRCSQVCPWRFPRA